MLFRSVFSLSKPRFIGRRMYRRNGTVRISSDWAVTMWSFVFLLALSVYLEVWLIVGVGASSTLLFSDESDNDGLRKNVDRCKKRYMDKLASVVFDQEEFLTVGRESGMNARLGTHSIRKYPATFARSNGCTIDEIDIRGRWKRNTKRVSDRYIDVEQQWIDGKVCSALCPGGSCKYELTVGSGISREWIRNFVVPGISSKYGQDDTISDVLGLPLLWACLDEGYSSRIPLWLRNRVSLAYDLIRILPPDVNPVKKILLVVYNVQGQLNIQEVIEGFEGLNRNNNGNNNNSNDQLNALLLQHHQMHARIAEMSNTITTTVSEGLNKVKKKLIVVLRYLIIM